MEHFQDYFTKCTELYNLEPATIKNKIAYLLKFVNWLRLHFGLYMGTQEHNNFRGRIQQFKEFLFERRTANSAKISERLNEVSYCSPK
jgi:hypothetical protein